MLCREPLDDRADPVALRADAPPRLGDVAGAIRPPLGEARAGADEIQRGAVGTGELAGVGRNSFALIRAIAAESSASSSGASSRLRCVLRGRSALEELVDDLDLFDAGAEAGERVDQALQVESRSTTSVGSSSSCASAFVL